MKWPILKSAIFLMTLGLSANVIFAADSPSVHVLPDVKWFRSSAERPIAYAQAYAEAWQIVRGRLSQGVLGPWAVVLDADETIIDNSEFQKKIELGLIKIKDPNDKSSKDKDAETFDKAWDEWLTDQARRAGGDSHEDFVFPSARDFAVQVHAAGGRIVIVTNRTAAQCARTETVLKAVADKPFPFDALRCDDDGSQDKEARFTEIESGKTPNVGTVNVLLFVGDNIKDCQGQTQKKYDPALFGTRCVMLPNPMYGSWTSNPDR